VKGFRGADAPHRSQTRPIPGVPSEGVRSVAIRQFAFRILQLQELTFLVNDEAGDRSAATAFWLMKWLFSVNTLHE